MACACFASPKHRLKTIEELGMAERYAEVSLLLCMDCGQSWLRYHYEIEAFTASGRWYLGAITEEQAVSVSAQNAKSILEGVNWYYYGGSYYDGRTGKTSGIIFLNP